MKVTIQIRGYTYRDKDDRIRFATRGDEIDVSAEEAKAGKAAGYFVPDASEEAAPAAPFDPVAASDDELIVWLQEEKPTVDEVVDAAQDEETAQRLLDAERSASGGNPRKGVVDGLEAKITSGNDD